MKYTKHIAFTIVEVLIVVVMIGIVAAIVVPASTTAREDARDGRRVADMHSVAKALELYANDFGVYPYAWGWRGDAPSFGGHGYSGSGGYIPNLAPTYIDVLPRDPNPAYPSGARGYLYLSNSSDFKFLAHQTPDSYTNTPLPDPTRATWAYAIYTAGGASW